MLIEYIRLYHEADLVDKAVGPGLPSTSVRRTLMLWIIWLLTSKRSILSEDQDQLEEFLFILRPYVFAAGHVSCCVAMLSENREDIEVKR